MSNLKEPEFSCNGCHYDKLSRTKGGRMYCNECRRAYDGTDAYSFMDKYVKEAKETKEKEEKVRKITLREFHAATQGELIIPGLLQVFVEEKTSKGTIKNIHVFAYDTDKHHPESMDDLQPYMDYEILSFTQEDCHGEIDSQILYLQDSVKYAGEQVIYVSTTDEAFCPCCEEMLADDEFGCAMDSIKFCPQCGTKLNWKWIKVRYVDEMKNIVKKNNKF